MKQLIFCLLLSMGLFTLNAQDILSTEKLPEVVIKGNGDTQLLLIPCMSCRWNAWEEFMDRNADQYKMLAVTLPGYGGTPLPDLPMNTAATPWRDHVLEALSDLIDAYALKDLVVVGHSWGSMVAVQLAAQRKDVVTAVISVDGTIESTSWTPSTMEERLAQADEVIRDWEPKLKNAEGWSSFNGAATGNTFGKTDSVSQETMLTRIKLIGSFMATNPDAVLQYWRENPIVDLTAHLKEVTVPVLDIQSFTGEDQQAQKAQYLEDLKTAGTASNVQSVFMYDTKHFIMYHRPLVLDCLIRDFISGKALYDYAPESSAYFEDEMGEE